MRYYSAKETAAEMGVSTRTLERWRAEKRFVPELVTMGGHSRYSENQIKLGKKGIFDGEVKDLLS